MTQPRDHVIPMFHRLREAPISRARVAILAAVTAAPIVVLALLLGGLYLWAR